MPALFPRACGGICMQHMSARKAPVGLQSTAAGPFDVEKLLMGSKTHFIVEDSITCGIRACCRK